MRLPNKLTTICYVGLSMSFSALLHADEATKDSQYKLSEWISIEKQISEDKHNWAMEKEIMADSISLMKDEISSLETRIKEFEESASTTEIKKADLNTEKESYNEISDAVKSLLAEYETNLKELFVQLPEPLLTQIKPLTSRMPEDPTETDTSASARLQNLVGILTVIDKFNSVVTKDSGIQEISDGTTAEVTKLYFGLATAYFVDGSGEYAGYGMPSETGWNWTVDNQIAESVKGLVGVYEGTKEASFITVPLTLKR